jgi:uncharacterized protein YegL
MSTELFTEQVINFSSKEFDSNFNKEDGKFGLLTLKAVLSNLTDKELELFFQIDCSGSMSDACSDGRTKMQHILHTLKNMILFLKENPSLNANITIHAFDDKIYKIVDRTQVNNATCDQIIHKIDTIRPRDSTNIEKALNDVNEYFNSTKFEVDCEKVSILMTDGQATSGKRSYSELKNHLDNTITNVFIGFGLDHDAKLLKTLSSGENSSYYFIDKLENAGLVYGEILHGIVYKFLENVIISVVNGLIYDYKTNTWGPTLYVGNIVSEGSKFYHLTSKIPTECIVEVSGLKVKDNSEFTTIAPIQEDLIDLTKYMYRQRTQELLFKVNSFNSNEDTITDYIEKRRDKKALRTELYNFFEELKKYMEDNQLEEDILLKNLCDDIYICYRTFGTNYGFMFCNARECSQGQQRAYTATQLPDDTCEYVTGIYRQNAILRSNGIEDFEYVDEEDGILSIDELQHNISGSTQTPYRSQTMTGVMRSCSAGANVEFKNIEDFEEEEQTQVL